MFYSLTVFKEESKEYEKNNNKKYSNHNLKKKNMILAINRIRLCSAN